MGLNLYHKVGVLVVRELQESKVFSRTTDSQNVMMWRKGKAYKITLCLYSVLEIFIFSGLIFGWNSLSYILSQEGYYADLCSEDQQRNASSFDWQTQNHSKISSSYGTADWRNSSQYLENGSTTLHFILLTDYKGISFSGNKLTNSSNNSDSSEYRCPQQQQQLHRIFIVTLTIMFVVTVPAGILTDSYGPRVTRVICALFFSIAGISWFFLSKERPWLIYVACIFMACGGGASYLAIVQFCSFAFHKYQATVIGMQSGAWNASASVLLLFKQIYDSKINHLSIQKCIAIYYGIAALLILLTSCTLISSKRESDEMSKSNPSTAMAKKSKTSDQILSEKNPENAAIHSNETNKTEPQTSCKESQPLLGDKNLRDMAMYSEDKTDVEKLQIAPSPLTQMRGSLKRELLRIFFSQPYFWLLWFYVLSGLKISFYIASFHNLILQRTASKNELSKYVDAFGSIQFLGIAFAPLLGPYIDGKCKRNSVKQIKNVERMFQAKIKRCGTAVAIISSVGIIQEVATLLPNLKVQYLSILSLVMFRAFVDAIVCAYVAITFPPKHFGKLISTATLIAGTILYIQDPLLSLMENNLNGNPFWIHVGLLILNTTLYGKCAYVWRKLGSKLDSD